MHQDSNIDLKLNKFGSPLIDYIKASGAKQVPRVAGDMHSEPHDSRNPTKDVTQKRVNVTSSISSTDQRRLTGFQASALASRLLADPSKPLDTQSAEIADHVGNLTLNNDDTLVDDVLQKGLDEGRGSFLCRISLSPPLNSQPPELSVEKITHAVESSGCQITLVHQDLTAVYLLIRRPVVHICDISEVRVCVVGNVDAGKSTLLGCLTRDTLDDGRGKSRLCMFRHKHEIETGRTSSVGSELMGFDSQGSIVPFLKRPQDVLLNAAKIITFMDLAGHEKYLKTTVFGITGHMPDYVMLMVGANAGVIGMTKEHLGLALALAVPVFIVVTKIDMCPPNILEQTIKQLEKILKSSGCRKAPLFVNDMPDVFLALDRFVSSRTCPIFQISNVTGQNLDLLKVFLNLLNYSNTKYDTEGMVEFQITETFSVPGVGTVVCGGLASGRVTVGDTLLLGPDSTGAFIPTMIKSIQRKRVPTNLVLAGQTCSFALKKVKRTSIRKGMVLVSSSGQPRAVQRFQAELLILFHSTTISERYQAMLHCNGVRQTAKIIHMDRDILRTGDRALVTFEFISHPEFLIEGSKLLIREGLRVNPGRTKGLGKVVKLLV